ncbi:SDR family oxidoreductase [soil metagenome]
MTDTSSFALITGASSGIGEEFAHLFAADGINVILVARDQEALQRVALDIKDKYGVSAIAKELDLTDKGALGIFLEDIKGYRVKYLVNSAGFGSFGPYLDTQWETVANMIELNVTSLSRLCHVLGASMKADGSGNIVNVASIAAFLPGPRMAVYYATKAYGLSFSEALAEELKYDNVSVTTLCPGPTATHFAETAHAENTGIFNRNLPSAKDVARYGYQSMLCKKRVAIHGSKNKLQAFLIRLTPRRVVAWAVGRAQK